ncbi:MAG: LysR family transcriptional regulator, partial [Myxococcales bacterium]|nr:LysR family transcriptional regulator [Myxococcales bacterium]
ASTALTVSTDPVFGHVGYSAVGTGMNLDQIRALVSLQVHGSLPRAAASLRVSQGTLRGRIKALEDEVGVALLGRAGRSLTLTPAGLELARGGRDLIDEAAAAIERVATGTQELIGSYRVAVPVGLPPAIMVMVLSYGHVRHPKLRSRVFPVARPLALLPDEADIAVTFEPRPTEGAWLSARIMEVKEGLFASPRYLAREGTPRSLEELERHRLFSWMPPGQVAEEWVLRAGGTAVVSLSHGSPDVGLIRQCALAGLGIARFPMGEIPDPDTPAGSLVPVLPELVGRTLPVQVVMPDSPRMRRPFLAFFDNLRAGVRGLADG